jgi:magnesium-dependent phosphatase 1
MLHKLSRLPGVVVFDLDDTLWEGEVDCSGGPPFKLSAGSRDVVLCCHNSRVQLFEDVIDIFDLLIHLNVPIAYASRTWQPSWAKKALEQFKCGTDGASDMWQISVSAGWGDCSKVSHIRKISADLNLPIDSMVFFDNELRNIRDISPLGATCGYCPDGLTMEIFQNKMLEYSNNTR